MRRDFAIADLSNGWVTTGGEPAPDKPTVTRPDNAQLSPTRPRIMLIMHATGRGWSWNRDPATRVAIQRGRSVVGLRRRHPGSAVRAERSPMAAATVAVRGGEDHHMQTDQVVSRRRRVAIVVANPATNNLGWPVGFWAAELTHPYYELTERGVEVTIASPDGGRVEMDALSDPRDPSQWSAEDLITMGFVNTPALVALLEDTPRLADLDLAEFDAIMVAGGQAPMFTFRDHEQPRPPSASSTRPSGKGTVRELRVRRPVQGLRDPRRPVDHRPAAVFGAQGRPDGHRSPGSVR
jgi:hypothetical protein